MNFRALPVYSTKIAISAAVFLCLAVGCSRPSGGSLEKALIFESNRDYRSAIIELKSVISEQPEQADLRFEIGRIYNLALDPVQAEKELERAKKLGATNGDELYFELVKSLFRQGKHQEIVKAPELDNLTLGTVKAGVLAYIGQSQLSLGNPVLARDALAIAQSLAPNNPDVGMLDAQLKVQENDWEGAQEAISSVLEAAPTNLFAWIFLAQIKHSLSQLEGALEALNQAQTLYPTAKLPLLERSNLYLRLGEPDKASKDAKMMMNLFPKDSSSHAQRAITEFALGNPKTAMEAARGALAIDAEHARSLLVLGLAQKELGSLSQAARALSQFVAIVPGNLLARRVLADIFIQLESPDQALGVLEPILERTVLQDAPTFIMVGLAYRAKGEEEEAKKWFAKAADVAPENLYPQAQLAISEINFGDRDAGIDALEAVVSKTKFISTADEILIVTFIQKGQLERAENIASRLEKLFPSNTYTYNIKGIIALAKGDTATAQAAFESALELDPKYFPAAANLAKIDLQTGDIESAQNRYKSVIDLAPDTATAYSSLAALYRGLGDDANAIAVLSKYLDKNPKNAPLLVQLLEIHLESGANDDGAQAVAELALSEHSTNSTVIALVAELFAASGKYDRAYSVADNLLGLKDKNPNTYVEIARIQFLARFSGEAETTLRKGLKTYPSAAPIHIALVTLLMDLNRKEDALEHATTVENRMKSPLGALLVGEIHERKKQYAEAVKSYEKALSLQPIGQLAAKVFVAKLKAGNSSSAIEWLESWVAGHPEDPVARIRLAEAHVASKNYALAIPHYERAVENDFIPLTGINNLAWCYYKVDDPRALEVAISAFRHGSDQANIVDTFGWILVESGELDAGLRHLRRAAVLDSGNPEIQYHLGAALLRNGDNQSAREILGKLVDSPALSAAKTRASELLNSLEK